MSLVTSTIVHVPTRELLVAETNSFFCFLGWEFEQQKKSSKKKKAAKKTFLFIWLGMVFLFTFSVIDKFLMILGELLYRTPK